MRLKQLFSIIFLAGLGYLFFRAGEEFSLLLKDYTSPKWQLAFFLSIFGAVIVELFSVAFLFFPDKLTDRFDKVFQWRSKLGVGCGVLLALFVVGVIFLLQYTIYGTIISSPAIRYSIGLLLILVGGFLLSKEKELVTFPALFQAALVVFTIVTAAVDFVGVTSFPFSQGWSEGNRLWDYSALFGRRLYDYPQDQEIFAYIDFGRQLVGGIPFIFNGISIGMARAWWALTNTLLYALFGWTIFRRIGEKGKLLLLLGLWTYLFINQGPIHPPLVVCAILVSLAWGRSYWVAVPLMVLSGYFAQISRVTWMFAPAMWILVLEFNQKQVDKTPGKSWVRPVVLSFAGLTGGVFFPLLKAFFSGSGAVGSSAGVIDNALNQGLLWYRLFPSATYGHGVIPGLLQAIVPILVVLVYLLVTRKWQLHIWQKFVISGVLLAFLVVGLIVSTKIGGGGDLHNMDMLLIGLVFVSVIAWKNGGNELFIASKSLSVLIQGLLLVLVILPGGRYLRDMKPLQQQTTEEEVQIALDIIREQVKLTKEDGQVLFMDQRQLLTFGYVEAPLIVNYEKKYLMDQALAGNEGLFQQYYQDLAEGNFDLIISEPLHTQQRGSEFVFGEENDAWVYWVSAPTLCFYEELPIPNFMRESIRMVLLVPKDDASGCEVFLQPDNLGE